MANKFLTTVDLTGNNLINVGTATISQMNATGGTVANSPVNPTDIANKSYVDGVAQGLDIKASVAAATTTALPSNTYNNGSSGVGATLTATANGALTVDGYTVATNNRLLIKNEATAANNGIYVVTQTGSGSTPYILTRSTDMDTPSQIPGAFTFVEQGTVNASSGWVVSTAGPFTIGTTAINFTQFSGAGELTYTSPILITGNNVSIGLDNVTVYNNGSNDLAVKSSATAGQSLISQGSGSAAWSALSLSTSAAITGTLPVSNGGTGNTSFTSDGILYGNGSSSLLVTAAGSQYQSLQAGSGGIPQFGAIALNQSAAISGTLPVGNGGTGLTSTTTGDLLLGSGSNTWSLLTIGTTNQVLTSNGTTASWVTPSSGGTVNKFATSIGNGSSTSFTITHNLGSLDAEIQVYEVATGNVVFPDMQNTTTNTSTITFTTAPTSNQYRVVVMA